MPKLLIMDDTRERGLQLSEDLEGAGFECRVTSAVGAALSEAMDFDPDLIFLGVGPSREDPVSICRQLRLAGRLGRVPILLVADSDHEAQLVGCIDAGASDWLQLPLHRTLLRRRVALALLERERLVESESEAGLSEHLDATPRRVDPTFLATHDPLTHLPNRQLFDKFLRKSLAYATRHRQTIGVLSIDLDNFKQVNHALGHEIGDRLLYEVADRLADCVRGTDLLARVGGDEFALLLTNLNNADDAAIVASKLVERFHEPFRIHGEEVFSTPSIGISICPDDCRTTEELLGHAEDAMRDVKAHGRNNYQFYVKQQSRSARERMRLEYHLRDALVRNEFVLYYQPQIDASKGTLIGAEALLRWISPELGMVAPLDFVPIAETSGLIRPLGEWVIGEACRQKKAWEDRGGNGFPVSVNVSFRQLTAGSLPDTVAGFLRDTGLEPSHLDLEITENTIMDDLDTALRSLRSLKEIGVSVSIDDFGTGYSSLSVLGSLPADTLKIDQAFVRDIANNQTGAAITRAVIAVAAELGLDCVAEGVETREEMEFIAALGCVRMQGYLFGRPLPAEEFSAEWLDGGDSPVKLREG